MPPKSLTDLLSNNIWNDLSVNDSIRPCFNFAEGIQWEATSLAKWFSSSLFSHFFCSANTNMSKCTLVGCPEWIHPPRQCCIVKQDGEEVIISFTKRELGLMWKCEWKRTTRSDLWTGLLLKRISLGESLCTLVRVPQFREHGSWGHHRSVRRVNQALTVPSICQLEFPLWVLLVCELGRGHVSSVVLKLCSADPREAPDPQMRSKPFSY